VYEALPVNAMLIVSTGQGDTAEVRRTQEDKWKRLQVSMLLTSKASRLSLNVTGLVGSCYMLLS
jgi:hypothetical protein